MVQRVGGGAVGALVTSLTLRASGAAPALCATALPVGEGTPVVARVIRRIVAAAAEIVVEGRACLGVDSSGAPLPGLPYRRAAVVRHAAVGEREDALEAPLSDAPIRVDCGGTSGGGSGGGGGGS